MSSPKPAPGHSNDPKIQAAQNHCFACGKDNEQGMHLQFAIDEQSREAICHFTLGRCYTGPPGHAHGGIIATILDEAMGKVNKLRRVVALTREMRIQYVKPVPLDQPLTVTSREQKVEGREHTNVAEITDAEGRLLARSTGVFVAVDPARMASMLSRQVQP
jgi:uncharacterized protein (TIGR00369 family)